MKAYDNMPLKPWDNWARRCQGNRFVFGKLKNLQMEILPCSKHLFQNGCKPGVVQFVHLGCQIAGFRSFAVVFWLKSEETIGLVEFHVLSTQGWSD